MAAGAAAGLSALAAAGLRAALLLDDPWAHGYDGWYYVLQVRSWMAGAPLFEDDSLVFVFLAILARGVGDVTLSNKLAACLFGAVTAGAGVVAAGRWTGSRAAALLCGVWWALSPLHLSLSAEFLKNDAGLAVLAVLLALLPGSERHRLRLGGVLLLGLLGLGVHKLTGGLGLLAVGGYAATRSVEGRLSPRHLGFLALAGLLGLLTLGLLRPVDLARLTGEGSPSTPRLAALFLSGRLTVAEQVEVALVEVAPFVLVGVLAWRGRASAGWAMGAGVLLLAAVASAPGLPFVWELTSWRLMLMGFLPVGLLMALLVSALSPRGGWALVGLALSLGLLQAPQAVVAGQRRSPDYAGWAAVVPQLQATVPPGERVIAHRGLCGFVWAEAGIVCENFLPEGEPTGWWRIVYGFSAERLSAYILPDEHPPRVLRPGYLLVQEASWRRFVAAEGARFRLTRDPRNPFSARPAYVYGPGATTPPDTRSLPQN